MVKDDDFTVPDKLSTIPKKERAVSEIVEYQLLNNYRDPFFHGLAQADEEFDPDEQVVVKPKIERKWPEIRFDGYILNGKKIKCHLTINGEDKILQVHEMVLEDYMVTAITSDSVEINCQGNSRWFKK